MRTMRCWWGLLCLAGMACADAPVVGPRTDPARAGRDLEFVLPAVREMPAVLREIDARSGVAEIFDPGADEASVTAAGPAPFIWSTFVKLAFDSTRLTWEYGMTGFGSGYSMTPALVVRTAAGGQVPVTVGSGRSEDLFFAWRFKPTVPGYSQLGSTCGMSADLVVQFEARMAGRLVNTSREQKQDQASASAPPCSPGSTTGSGTTGSGPTYYLTVCSFELWVDLDGNIIDVILLGCSTVALPQLQ